MTREGVLVTGGPGFIGSAVIRRLITETDFSVMNYDLLTYARDGNLVASARASVRYQFVRGDICDAERVAMVLRDFRPTIIMHLAAESHVDRSIQSATDFVQTNIVGTYVMLNEARNYYMSLSAAGQSRFKFHHISTDEVYGDLPHPDDSMDKSSTHKFVETTPYNPSSPYSATKASSDHLVRAWSKTFGLPVVVINCSNNYGPFQFPEKLSPLMILKALDGESLPVYGHGQKIRDWLYVEDHAEALLLVALGGEISSTYNIGGCNEWRNIEVVRLVCEILDQLSPPMTRGFDFASYKDLITYVEDRPGHDKRYAIDSSKIAKELNWQPRETFESGLEKTISWYLENLDWCRHRREEARKQVGETVNQ